MRRRRDFCSCDEGYYGACETDTLGCMGKWVGRESGGKRCVALRKGKRERERGGGKEVMWEGERGRSGCSRGDVGLGSTKEWEDSKR